MARLLLSGVRAPSSDTLDKNLVKMPDGTYKAFSMEEYTQLRKAGKIKTGSVDVLIDDSGGITGS